MTVVTLAWPVMAIVSPSGTFCRPASVTNPLRIECAEKLPSSPARRQRSCTIFRTAEGESGSATTVSFRIRRNSGPDAMPLADNQLSSVAAITSDRRRPQRPRGER